MGGPSVSGGRWSLGTRTLDMTEDGVGELSKSRDAPVEVAIGSREADWATKTPDGQVEGQDGRDVRGLRWGVAREEKK